VGKFFSLEFYFGFQNIFSWKFSTWNKDSFSSLATDIVNKKIRFSFWGWTWWKVPIWLGFYFV